jgi:integrase
MSKLITTTSADFSLPFAVHRDGTVETMPAAHLPQLRYPDGSPHVLGDLFLQHLHNTGVSNYGGQGTLRTDADLLAPFINWCHGNSRDVIGLSNNDFELFVLHLKEEKSGISPTQLKRRPNQVTRIGTMALRFLHYVDSLFCTRRLLAPEGSIQVLWKVSVELDADGRERRSTYMTHAHLPPPTSTRRRRLVSDDAVLRMMVANKNRQCSRFLKRRAGTLIWVLDITGGRIDEVASIQVQDIYAALADGYLTLKTVKRIGGPTPRRLPVSEAELQQVLWYIKHDRPASADGRRDVGPLFTSARGKGLTKQTLSGEVSKLRRLAGIEDEEVVAHSFRHRFLTRKLAEIYAEHGCQTSADLKQLILSDEAIRDELMEWSGHKSVEGFNRYIHIEFGRNGRFGVDIPSIARTMGEKTAMAAGFNEVMAFAQDGDEDGALDRLEQMRSVVSATARGRRQRRPC